MNDEALRDRFADRPCGVHWWGRTIRDYNWPIRKYTTLISRFQSISETPNQSKHRNQRFDVIGLSLKLSNVEQRSGQIGGESPISGIMHPSQPNNSVGRDSIIKMPGKSTRPKVTKPRNRSDDPADTFQIGSDRNLLLQSKSELAQIWSVRTLGAEGKVYCKPRNCPSIINLLIIN